MTKNAPIAQPSQNPDAKPRITYKRDVLLQYRNSPLSKGFPVGAKTIPGILEPAPEEIAKKTIKSM